MTDQKDAYYIRQVLEGNVNAYACLVEKYKGMVFTLAVRILKDRETAEEVAQDVFVKSYQSLSGFKGNSKFATWLYSITYNASMDVLKRNKKFTASEAVERLSDTRTTPEENALERLMTNDRNEAVNAAVAALPEEDRTIIWLYYFDELSLREIAKVVNLSVANVKIKLYRSRKRLYTLLEHNTIITA
ncbi:MAG: sigma-70 family RNA polymerase sigma factor [Sinomicrobium sp.]|nr:sigma-70 family RNA polymerase sigma factor [Sinomicrobium sp.]